MNEVVIGVREALYFLVIIVCSRHMIEWGQIHERLGNASWDLMWTIQQALMYAMMMTLSMSQCNRLYIKQALERQDEAGKTGSA